MTEDKKNIQFIGHVSARDDAMDFVDKILQEKGNFEDYADLSGGLNTIATEFRIEITDDDDSYALKVNSVSGSGEELVFSIDKGSGTIYRPVSNSDEAPIVDDEDIDFLDDI